MYCVYLTIYKGTKLPRWYIGMSSVAKVKNGYRGSVSSKRYKNIWKQELRENPDLFETVIIHEEITKEGALAYEHKLQVKLDVVRRPDFINLANAGGFGGIDKSIITEVNKGRRIVILKATGCFVKIKSEDFDPDIHASPKSSDLTKSLISKNTSKSMKGKIEDGSHWFLSEDFIKKGIERRKGKPRPQSVKDNVSKGRKLRFKDRWKIPPYNDYDWNSICTFVSWYFENKVKHSQIFAELARNKLSELHIAGGEAKWLYRQVSRKETEEIIQEICENYKRSKYEGS